MRLSSFFPLVCISLSWAEQSFWVALSNAFLDFFTEPEIKRGRMVMRQYVYYARRSEIDLC